jgi:hypothetical protein
MRGDRPLTRLAAASRRRSTLSHKGRGEASEQKRLSYGAIDTGEKSTNQLFGCTNPLTLGLIARGATSWAT